MYGRPQFKDFSRVKNKFKSNGKEVRVLKFVFSKKATKIDEIFTGNLTLTT